ncbi:toll/interleukin-1 receptor domain-containing protein [Halomonas sp. A29]|uniref:toll/interleukin-1 receptor domain-containing protein n=1 Tax=Halomonas sp. A29 TaxID=3102786 RepID=UPI00398ACA75
MTSVFFSYSHADEELRDQLEKQLSILRRQGVIETWHDRRIGAGQELHGEISQHVENDDVILLLVSSDFLASDYCYETEMLRAIERHDAGEAVVIPVILRACDWHSAPFGKLMATPTDGKPVMQWADRDQAMLEVVRAVREAVQRIAGQPKGSVVRRQESRRVSESGSLPSSDPVRSSNLRVAKRFSDRDKDAFRHETFEYLAKFFENSLEELANRNPDVDGSFRRVDANRFTATVYRDGKTIRSCTVFLGGLGDGIAFAQGTTDQSSSYNELLSVHADDQMLYLRSLGMAHMGRFAGDREEKLSPQGAAELYWEILIEPLQHR